MKIVTREEFMGMSAGTIFVPVLALNMPHRHYSTEHHLDSFDFPMVLTKVVANGIEVKGDPEKPTNGIFVINQTQYILEWEKLDDPVINGACDFSDYQHFTWERGPGGYRVLTESFNNCKCAVQTFAIFTDNQEAWEYVTQLRFAANIIDFSKVSHRYETCFYR